MKTLSLMFHKLGYLMKRICDKIAILIYQPKTDIENKPLSDWFALNGDKTLRLNYDLNTSSNVFDLGGYKGEWSKDLFCKYQCNIYIFEPVPEFYNIIKNNFNPNKKIRIYNFGLAGADQNILINVDANSSSMLKKGNHMINIELKSIKKFIENNKLSTIDIVKINIEGAEFELLEALISDNLISIFKNIQVQFHNFVPNSKDRMDNIKSKLSATHYPTYQYEFVWENWKINDSY